MISLSLSLFLLHLCPWGCTHIPLSCQYTQSLSLFLFKLEPWILFYNPSVNLPCVHFEHMCDVISKKSKLSKTLYLKSLFCYFLPLSASEKLFSLVFIWTSLEFGIKYCNWPNLHSISNWRVLKAWVPWEKYFLQKENYDFSCLDTH